MLMNKLHHDVLLLLTFVTGFFLGLILYIYVFAPDYVVPLQYDESKIAFAVSGTELGTCEQATGSCTHFMLRNDHTYMYWKGDDKKHLLAHGLLANDTFNQLKTSIEQNWGQFTIYTADSPATCADPLYHQYRIVVSGQGYTVSSCSSSLAASGIGNQLDALWPQVATSTTWIDRLGEFNLYSILSSWSIGPAGQ